MVLLTIAMLRLKESRPSDLLFMIKFLFTRSVMISSNDSLVMLEAIDLLMNEAKSRINIWALLTNLFQIVDCLKYLFFKM